MKIIITGKNLDVSEGLRNAVEEKIGKLEKYFAEDTTAKVTLSVEKDRQKIEVTIPVKGNIIRSEQERAPLLLYLHGGPGDTALPLVLKYNRELERSFTVAVWEQRGAGKSYYPFRPDETITIDTFLQDLLELTQYLLDHFHQKKLYLVGHSWGSVLGLRFIQHNQEYEWLLLGTL